MLVADRPDQIAFHDLHVVDVVEQLHPRRGDRLHDRHAERRAIALVVLVVDLAVQQLDADRDAVILGDLLDAVEAGDAVGGRLLVAHAAPVAEERDDVGHLHRRGARDRRARSSDDRVVVGRDVQAVADRAAAGVAHRADEAVLARDRPVRLLEQIDRGQPHVRDRAAELGQRDASYGQRDTDCFSRPFLTLRVCNADASSGVEGSTALRSAASAARTAAAAEASAAGTGACPAGITLTCRLRQVHPITIIGRGAVTDVRHVVQLVGGLKDDAAGADAPGRAALECLERALFDDQQLLVLVLVRRVRRLSRARASRCGFRARRASASACASPGAPRPIRSALLSAADHGYTVDFCTCFCATSVTIELAAATATIEHGERKRLHGAQVTTTSRFCGKVCGMKELERQARKARNAHVIVALRFGAPLRSLS